MELYDCRKKEMAKHNDSLVMNPRVCRIPKCNKPTTVNRSKFNRAGARQAYPSSLCPMHLKRAERARGKA